jgi:Spy/CpxP family protein refolding chaperone
LECFEIGESSAMNWQYGKGQADKSLEMEKNRGDMKTTKGIVAGASQMGKIGIGIVVAALAVASSGTVWAQGPDGGLGMGPHRPPMEREMGPRGEHARWWNGQHAIEKLKLTDAQRKAMDDIYMQNRLTLVDLHGTLEKAELEMEPLLSADQPDEGKILAQIDHVAQARAELEKANARMLLGIRRQLTAEQWKLMQADRAARREGRDQGGPGQSDHQRWHRPGGQGGPGAGTPPPAQGPGEQ